MQGYNRTALSFHMIPPSAPRSSQWSLSCKSAHLCTLPPHNATCSTHPPWYHHPTDNSWTHHDAPLCASLLLPTLPYAQRPPQHRIFKHHSHTFFHVSICTIITTCNAYHKPMHFVCFTAVTKSILIWNIFRKQQHRLKTMSVQTTSCTVSCLHILNVPIKHSQSRSVSINTVHPQ
jgi:hypothetical protein